MGLGAPVFVADPAGYAAIGAARQAAWALSDSADPPVWAQASGASYDALDRPQVRERYATVRDLTSTREQGSA